MIYIIKHRKEVEKNVVKEITVELIDRQHLKNIVEAVNFFNGWGDWLPDSCCKLTKAHYEFKYHYKEFLPSFDFNKCNNTTYTTMNFWYLEKVTTNNIAYLWRGRKNPLAINIASPDLSDITNPEAKAIILSILAS